MKKIKLKINKKKLKKIGIIVLPIILIFVIYIIYAFFPIQKSHKENIPDKQQWIAYIQYVDNWCSVTPPKLYIYEDGSYIIKEYKNNNYKEIDKGKIKTLYNIENTINRLSTRKKSKSGISYYIKFKDGKETTINILTKPKLSHYINKIPKIKKKLNVCK